MSAPAGVARMPAGFRQPPHNLHAERLVLGTLLANSRRFGVVSHMLRAEHFYVPDHQACFERIERASAKGEYFDWTTIAGGMDPEPLARLADGAASIQSDELCAYARVVVDLAHRRALIRISDEMQNRAYDTTLPETAAEQLAVARGYLQALANESAAGQKEQIKLIMADQCTLETDVFWAIEGVLPRCSMMMLYARGGAGKTYLGTSLAFGLATGQWFSHKAEHGAVLVCAFERPQDAEDRLAATRDRLGIQGAPVALLRLAAWRSITPWPRSSSSAQRN